MGNFSKEIDTFQKNGTYTYNFDSFGNIRLVSSSSNFNAVYVSLDITNFVYNNSKIQSFYNPTFTEFIPAVTSSILSTTSQDQINNIVEENKSLKGQLNSIISSSAVDSTASNTAANKQVIIQLRTALGQNKNSSGFSDAFPYLPIPKVQ